MLKPSPMHTDMPFAFVAMLLAAREELILANKFSDFVEMIYLKGKAISIDGFIAKYIRVAAGSDFYQTRWDYENIPVEAIKLDKINLGKQIGTAAGGDKTGRQPTAADDKLIEDNMDRILKENVLPDDQEPIPEGEGLLLDPSLLKDLDKEAALNSGKKPKSIKGKKKKGDDDPLMGDYKSVKKAGTKDGSSKPSGSGGIDILSDMKKPDKKTPASKVPGSSKDVKNKQGSNKTFSLPASDSVRDPSSKRKPDVKKGGDTAKSKKDSKRSAAGEEEDDEPPKSSAKKSDPKKIRKPASKSKDKDGSPPASKKKLPPAPKKK